MVEEGVVLMKHKQINTDQEKEVIMKPSSGIMHVPSYVAFARKNIGKGPAVVIIFSDRSKRSDDDYEYEILNR